MKYELATQVDIDATPAEVWAVLTDLDAYEEWNPFIDSAEGEVRVGAKLKNHLTPPNGKAMTFKPTVTVADENATFEWLGHLGMPGIFDGRHRFDLEATSTGTRVTQSEQFNGIMVRPFIGSLEDSTRAGFEAMNSALKDRVEA